MSAALICGSLAYDTIMVYSGQFKNAILPDKVHILNVSFLVPQLRRDFGGTAGNIAYNLKLLGGEPRPMGTVGHDFTAYAQWLDRHEIDRRHLKIIDDQYTAQAYITTDLDDNQITAFHPGAMAQADTQDIVSDGVAIGSISAESREAMLLHAQQFAVAGVPFIFDPGQGIPLFNGAEFRDFIDKASYVAVNDYEAEILMDRTGWSLEAIAERVQALIVTRGGKGSQIHVRGEVLEIPCAKADSLTDPTGCGDAYRGGLLYGLSRGLDWETTGRIASLMGAYCIERPGTQNHGFTMDAFRERYRKAFRAEMP